MKPLLIAALLLSLTGCAADMRQRLIDAGNLTMQQQAAAAQWRAQAAQQQQAYKPIAVKQTDYQCFNGCLQAGYQYGLCDSRCSY